MKKLIVLSAAILASGLMAKQADAQIRLGINLHFGARPEYVAPAPVVDDQFYYLPDVEAYYSVNENCYYYNDGYNWISAAYLPGAYRDYDWRNARRFAVNEPRPYLHDNDYRARYGGVEHRDWNVRVDRDRAYDNRGHFDGDRVYADRDRVDHNQYRGDDHRMQEPQRNEQWNNRGQQQFDNHGDDHRGAQAQPQQNDNRGNYGRGQQQQAQPQQNYNRGNQQQQAQPQQNNNRGNSIRGAQRFS